LARYEYNLEKDMAAMVTIRALLFYIRISSLCVSDVFLRKLVAACVSLYII
tara:strand:- start:103 stop:255 length:153 start_codon:yes stop_codon:yes gene_type:complete